MNKAQGNAPQLTPSAGPFAPDGWLRRQGLTFLVAVVVLSLAGLCLRPVHDRAWPVARATLPETRVHDLEGALGQGVLLAVLGGFRAIVADLVFIQMTAHWEDDNREKVESLIDVATTIDPRPEFFWVNGSRIIAYDIRHWRVEHLGGREQVPEAVQRRINREQAERALALLDRALEYHPDEPTFLLEKAQIYANRLKNKEQAAHYFHRAWEQDGPYYAGRIYAVLLTELGRHRDAYDFLRGWWDDLPEDDFRANKALVLERIRSLEDKLGIPEHQRLPVDRAPRIFPYQQMALPVAPDQGEVESSD